MKCFSQHTSPNYKPTRFIWCNGDNFTIHCLIINFQHIFQTNVKTSSHPPSPFLKAVLTECAISLASASHAGLAGAFLQAFQRRSPLIRPGTLSLRHLSVVLFKLPGSHDIIIGLPVCLVALQVTSDNGEIYLQSSMMTH